MGDENAGRVYELKNGDIGKMVTSLLRSSGTHWLGGKSEIACGGPAHMLVDYRVSTAHAGAHDQAASFWTQFHTECISGVSHRRRIIFYSKSLADVCILVWHCNLVRSLSH